MPAWWNPKARNEILEHKHMALQHCQKVIHRASIHGLSSSPWRKGGPGTRRTNPFLLQVSRCQRENLHWNFVTSPVKVLLTAFTLCQITVRNCIQWICRSAIHPGKPTFTVVLENSIPDQNSWFNQASRFIADPLSQTGFWQLHPRNGDQTGCVIESCIQYGKMTKQLHSNATRVPDPFWQPTRGETLTPYMRNSKATTSTVLPFVTLAHANLPEQLNATDLPVEIRRGWDQLRWSTEAYSKTSGNFCCSTWR